MGNCTACCAQRQPGRGGGGVCHTVTGEKGGEGGGGGHIHCNNLTRGIVD